MKVEICKMVISGGIVTQKWKLIRLSNDQPPFNNLIASLFSKIDKEH